VVKGNFRMGKQQVI